MVKKSVKKRGKKNKVPVLTKKKKYSIILKNLLLFLTLSLISLIFIQFQSNQFFISLFYVLTIIFGLIALALLIVFLILILIKKSSKK
jgi:hypothetical protein